MPTDYERLQDLARLSLKIAGDADDLRREIEAVRQEVIEIWKRVDDALDG